jgi:hypothetical protein
MQQSFLVPSILIKIFLGVLNTTLKSSVTNVILWSGRNKIQVTQFWRFHIIDFVHCQLNEHESAKCSTSKKLSIITRTPEKNCFKLIQQHGSTKCADSNN